MNTVNRLTRDHAIFRSKLGVLESAVRMGPEAWFVLREECFSLARQLEDHDKREHEFLTSGHDVLENERIARLSPDHEDDRRQLGEINQFFMEQPSCFFESLRPAITVFIADFQQRMDHQETMVFPLLEDALVLRELRQAQEGLLNEVMTVQEVVTRYPRAKAVLERLFMDSAFERYDCLDEVAWRHGMESGELLGLLEEAIFLTDSTKGKEVSSHA